MKISENENESDCAPDVRLVNGDFYIRETIGWLHRSIQGFVYVYLYIHPSICMCISNPRNLSAVRLIDSLNLLGVPLK